MDILPLHQDPGDDAVAGTIENPVVICPVCEAESRVTGMTWMGAVNVGDMADADLDDLTDVLIAWMGEMTRRQSEMKHQPLAASPLDGRETSRMGAGVLFVVDDGPTCRRGCVGSDEQALRPLFGSVMTTVACGHWGTGGPACHSPVKGEM